jgi:hypothetical protein
VQHKSTTDANRDATGLPLWVDPRMASRGTGSVGQAHFPACLSLELVYVYIACICLQTTELSPRFDSRKSNNQFEIQKHARVSSEPGHPYITFMLSPLLFRPLPASSVVGTLTRTR